MSSLDAGFLRDTIKEESGALASIGEGNLHLEIPHIEGWTVQSVVGHTGWVFRYITAALQSTPENPPSRSVVPEPPPSDEVIEWMSAGADGLLAELASADLETVRPTFTGPQPASWWLRRVAHEVTMHRWDAEAACGSATPINPDLARDGIDEVFQVFAPARTQFAALDGKGETVHLHATDTDNGEWLLTYQPDRIDWEHTHSKGDAAARGPVSDLLLLLWGRIPPSRLELFGDTTLLDRWQQAAKF